MIILTMNGQPVPNEEVDGLQQITVTGRTDANILLREITSELTFYGHAYAVLYSEFAISPTALSNLVYVTISDDCCDNYVFNGVIGIAGVKWCSNQCAMTTKILENKPKFACFKSTVITDNTPNNSFPSGFQNYEGHPRVDYCNELRPNFIQHILIIMALLWNITLLILTPVVAIISAIVSVVCWLVNLFGGNCPDDLANGILDDYENAVNSMNEMVIGCGRTHPSPLVRNYVKNVCEKCGLTFQSSILNDAASLYFNMLYFNAPVKKGCKTCTTLIKDNLPLKTLDMLLDDIKPLFSADYVLRDDVLVFERRDKLKLTNIVFDFTTTDKDKLQTGICYEWNGQKKPAYISAYYTKDPIEICGNEALNYYDDIVDFNIPFNQTFTGSLEVAFPFAPARFRGDGIEEDVLHAYEWVPYFGTIISMFDNDLILGQNTAYMPKLLIWDGLTISHAKVKIYPTPSGYEAAYPQDDVSAPYQLFNYPMYVDQVFNDQGFKNLWEFLQIEDPRSIVTKKLTWTLTFKYKCEDIPKLQVWSGAILDQGIGTIDEYTINFDDHTVMLKGTL